MGRRMFVSTVCTAVLLLHAAFMSCQRDPFEQLLVGKQRIRLMTYEA